MRQHDGGWATNFNGMFDFGRNVNNPLDTNNPYSNAILGIFNNYTEATFRPLALRHSVGVDWFVQDNWKISRRLTLDYGVRVTCAGGMRSDARGHGIQLVSRLR